MTNLSESGRAHEGDIVLTEEAEAALYAIAENLGILVKEEEAEALLGFLEQATARALSERAMNPRGTASKLDQLVSHSALVMAQQNKDPLFQKYSQASEIRRKVRDVIIKKYRAQAATTARKLLQNAGRKNMVDVTASKHFNADDRHSEVPKPRASKTA
jgi:hypothetical protein